ncbi:MAG: site-specific integrase [Candidatus Obscuribacterales bacterium]|nr:site-specific integrase [Candidatus Obscuribacterales bacterium]
MNSSASLTVLKMAEFRTWLSGLCLSRNTLLTYNLRIESYLRFCRERAAGESDLLSEDCVREYLEHLSRAKTAATFNVSVAALEKLFLFFRADFPPIQRMKCSFQKKVLTRNEIEHLLLVIRQIRSRKARILCLLCFHGDLAVSGCVDLNRDDLIVRDGSVLLRTPSGVIEMTEYAASCLVDWQASTNGSLVPLVPNTRGERMTRGGVDYLIKTVGIKAGLELSAQLLRDSGRFYRSQCGFSADAAECDQLNVEREFRVLSK